MRKDGTSAFSHGQCVEKLIKLICDGGWGLQYLSTCYLWGALFQMDAIDSSSVALFIVLRNLKRKSKPSGLPDSNFIFFVATKPIGSILESEAKESFALRWACLARQGGNLNSDKAV